jgi:sugar phosphate isomerase/epimerase
MQTRREALRKLGLASMLAMGGTWPLAAATPENTAKPKGPFRLCFNTSNIRGQKLGLIREMEITAQAGFQGIEIWVETLKQYLAEGGTVEAVRQKASALKLSIEGAIGFANWIVDDPEAREKGLQQADEEMALLAAIGCKRLAAPPAGAIQQPSLDLKEVGKRYAALLDIGKKQGVLPLLELWGFSANLSRLSEVYYVAAESGHPDAAILADVYHLYKGGSSVEGLRLIDGARMPLFHINDYPDMAPAQIADKDRVMPGDGTAPLSEILRILAAKNQPITLSLELFSEALWKRDPLEVAREGFSKMKKMVATV